MSRATWVLLRGLTREQGHWGDFVPQLRAVLTEQDTLLTPDLPGNGTLYHAASPTRVEDMVASCRTQLVAQGHRPPYRIVAMSLGAMVAIAWANSHPDEIEACVLINTSLRPYSPFWHRLRPRQYLRILRLLMSRASADQWENAIMAMTTRHPASPHETLARWLQLREQHPVSMTNAMRQLWAAARYRAPAQAPKVPMLLLNGQGDQLVHPDCSATLAQRWHLPLVRHPTAGHDLPLDSAPWVVGQILAWQAAGLPPHPAAHAPAC